MTWDLRYVFSCKGTFGTLASIYVITCKTISGTSTSYLIRVRPCLGQWHGYVITCKTTSGTLALYDMCDYPSILFNFKWFNGH
ncbi:WD repeat-containing 55 [Gossypium arboreum]|uniref:WD repeat-containing 55 n=1 Tax=Gossypium arboreum TaxID=29729 RepID=A0A0B0PU29_GOSAR|nr:WD repeat-containing 55 [Gossypium arboreum]